MIFQTKGGSERIALWIKQNFNSIVFVLSFFALIALAFIGWNQYVKQREKQAQESLYQLKKAWQSALDAEVKKTKGKALSANKKKAAQLSPEIRERTSAYEEAIRQEQTSRTGAVFAIDLADFYYQRGEEEKAKSLLSLFAFPERPSSLYHLASFQLASYYMSAKECEKALDILSKLSLNKKAAPFHLESDLQQAFCLEHLKRYDQALNKYNSVINKDPEGYTSRLAQDYKKMMELSRNIQKEK